MSCQPWPSSCVKSRIREIFGEGAACDAIRSAVLRRVALPRDPFPCARWIGGHGSSPPVGRAEGYPRNAGLNQHPRCADSCCPAQCPPAEISTASTWPTGPYDGPPSVYPGLASQALPYAAGLPGLRGADGPGTGRGRVGSTWVHAGGKRAAAA